MGPPQQTARPPQQTARPSAIDRIFNGCAYVSIQGWKLTTSAVIVACVATILWTGAVYAGWLSLSLPYYGALLPYFGPLTIELAEFAASVSVFVLATLGIYSMRS